SSRRRHTRLQGDWSSDVCSSDLHFLKSAGLTAAAATAGVPLWATARVQAAPTTTSAAETAVKALFDTLSDKQKKAICFDWDYVRSEERRVGKECRYRR